MLVINEPIYFKESDHKYVNKDQVEYTSMTTLISKYKPETNFEEIAEACEKIGRNPSHPKYKKYRGLSKAQILRQWRDTAKSGTDRGTIKHNYLEDQIRKAANYRDKISTPSSTDFIKLYTINSILQDHDFGTLDLNYFKSIGIKDKYPKIYELIKGYILEGFKVYPEICTYNPNLKISGLIDLLLVKGDYFIILDWKTNKDPIRFNAGYYEKDNHGIITNKFIIKSEYMKYPINHIPASTGHIYALQLSGYAYLTEQFGLACQEIVLCHIQEDPIDKSETTTILPIPYLKDEVKSLMSHNKNNQ